MNYFFTGSNYLDQKRRLKKIAIPSLLAHTTEVPSLINNNFMPNILKRGFAKKGYKLLF